MRRFWDKVEKTDSCWHWLASKNSAGYGRFNAGKDAPTQYIQAHKYAYETLVGKVPAGLVLDHTCRNRACVNPAHLEPVTIKENVLRGEGIATKHAVKTVCPQGHEYTDENTYLYKGMRYCRACRKKRQEDKAK